MLAQVTLLSLMLPSNQPIVSDTASDFEQLCHRPSSELYVLFRNRRTYFSRAANKPDDSVAEQLARAIITRGVASVPTLLRELESNEELGLELGAGEFNFVTQVKFLDPKTRTKGFKGEPDDNDLLDLPSKEGYLVARSDASAFLLGLITNRLYFRPEIYPGMTFFSTLSTQKKDVVAVIKDWQNLSPDGLRKSFEYDVLHPDSSVRQLEGFAALRFYYPERDLAIAVKALDSAYLSCPSKNANVSSSLMNELIPISNDQIDSAVIKLAKRFENSEEIRTKSPFALLHCLAYLATREKYKGLTTLTAARGASLQPEYSTYYDSFRIKK